MHMIILKMLNRPQVVASTEATFLESELHTIVTAHHKPSVIRESQTSRHKAVEKHDDEKLKHDYKGEVYLSYEYACHFEQILNVITEFQFM